jgi:hypothetical protein
MSRKQHESVMNSVMNGKTNPEQRIRCWAAMWPNVEVFAVHDAVHDVFVKLLAHTRTREDNVQPVVEGAMRLLLGVLLSEQEPPLQHR